MTKVLGSKIYKYILICMVLLLYVECQNKIIKFDNTSSIVTSIDFKGFENKNLNNVVLIKKKKDIIIDTISLEFDFNAIRDSYLIDNEIFPSSTEVLLDTIHDYQIYFKDLEKSKSFKINKIGYSIKRAGFNDYRICEIKEYEINDKLKTLNGIIIEKDSL